MSMDRCPCGAIADTDDEPEAYTLFHADGREEETEVCRCVECRVLEKGAVLCNECGWTGDEDDLVWCKDKEEPDNREGDFKGCPICKDDGA